MTPCMGGFCSRRDNCLHYTSAGFAQPVERLCFEDFEYPSQIGVETMGNRNEQTHAEGAKIAAWIALVGNQTSTAISARFGFEQHYTSVCLTSALIDGHLAKVRVGYKYLWTLPCDAEKLREAGVELSRIEKLRKRTIASSSEFDDEPGDEPFSQRTIPADGALPITIRYPTSIFNMVAP